jgi:hypothetical protein
MSVISVAEFEQLNPLRYVPVLVDGDVVVSDSLAILLVSVLCSERILCIL